jgi:TonB family protein
MFNSLQSDSATRSSWWISFVLHGAVLTLLIAVPLVFPESLNVAISMDKYNVTALIPPAPVAETPKLVQPPTPAPIPPQKATPPPAALALREPMPTVEVRKDSTPPPPPAKLEIALSQPQPVIPPPAAPAPVAAPAAPREVVTGVLPANTPDLPKVNRPAREVQTGGFGDPNGVRGEGRPTQGLTMARLGSFDLPAGPGTGNGTGGARGSQGVVASAGFGNGAASGNTAPRTGANAVVQQGAFGDGRPDPAAASRPARPAATAETPVEVTFKPRPEYTEDARKAREEGEVLVRVLFSAAGTVRVLEVVRGLPYGLSESALRAAQQIRFKPATKDGRPVDSVAVVHINFQLAY